MISTDLVILSLRFINIVFEEVLKKKIIWYFFTATFENLKCQLDLDPLMNFFFSIYFECTFVYIFFIAQNKFDKMCFCDELSRQFY